MLSEFSEVTDLPTFDVCIVGAGPAGITLALKLGDSGLKVGLLEAGGLEYDQRSQDVYQIESVGRDLYAATTRLRYFGGTSNHWSGRCRPFVREDFERKMVGDLPGWPISFDEFNQYLPEAMRILDLPAEGFTERNIPVESEYFEPDKDAPSPPTRFAEKYKEPLKESKNISLFLNCNLVNIECDNHGRIAYLDLVGYDKKQNRAKARYYVLAMGAIENSRMLLNSSSLMGLDHLRKMAGVGFMEHLNVEMGEFFLKEPEADQINLNGFTSQALVSTKDVGRGNVTFGIIRQIKSYGRTAKIKTFLKGLVCDLSLQDKVDFITKINCPGEGVITTLLEQFPERKSNRIELSKKADYFGLRRAKLNWQLSERDVRTIRVVAMEAAKAFANSGLGFVKLRDYILHDDVFMPVSPHAHHMGGTRMAVDRADGVVDTDSKVFGVDNLFIAGSSVFATGGGGNPTMPLLQLTLRLADHLKTIAKA